MWKQFDKIVWLLQSPQHLVCSVNNFHLVLRKLWVDCWMSHHICWQVIQRLDHNGSFFRASTSPQGIPIKDSLRSLSISYRIEHAHYHVEDDDRDVKGVG